MHNIDIYKNVDKNNTDLRRKIKKKLDNIILRFKNAQKQGK